ncbi:PAN2-PAN3 deadenylation complex subunit pan3 [Pelomyxa schiedti]|nr:PAN2-PAN3 deadenylation complex subunit pan3 [Pelomyxa schiedti]
MSNPITPVCRYFAASGVCAMGEQCPFLHSFAMPQYTPRSQRMCRNVSLYGYCKYAGKGCEYNHSISPLDTPGDSALPYHIPEDTLPLHGRQLSVSAPPNPSLPLSAITASPFVPSAASFTPSNNSPPRFPHGRGRGGPTQLSVPIPQASTPPRGGSHTSGRADDRPFSRPQLYKRNISSLFMNENMRQELLLHQRLCMPTPPDDPRARGLPRTIHMYHSPVSIDTPSQHQVPNALGHPTDVYKATSLIDGDSVVLYKVEGLTSTGDTQTQVMEKWKQLLHPGIVSLRECFVGKEISDQSSTYFVYDYHPGTETLEHHIGGKTGPFTEPVVWSFVCQLASALSTIHAHGQAYRTLAPSKILVTSRNRLRLNCCGILDFANFDHSKISAQQVEDMVCLGRVILSICCRVPFTQTANPTLQAPPPLPIANSDPTASTTSSSAVNIPSTHTLMDRLGVCYSPELCHIVSYLLSPTSIGNAPNTQTANDLLTMLSLHMTAEADNLRNLDDQLQSDLKKQLECGRLFRLIAKLGFITDHPTQTFDPSWSGTGDRYPIKLFRDYVFHQSTEEGNPVVDLAHVVQSLNKLDFGSSEQLLLLSHDEQSMIVTSYADLNRCVEEAFNDLVTKATKS